MSRAHTNQPTQKKNPHDQEDTQEELGQVHGLPADQGEKDVSPVELAHGKEVKGRDQDPDPSREGDRVEKDVRAGRNSLEQ